MRPISRAWSGSSNIRARRSGATIGRTCQSNSVRLLTSRLHHELTPPMTYGYVPSVVSRTRGRARPTSSSVTAVCLDACVGALHRRRGQGVELGLEGHHRALDLLADLEQGLADHQPVD